MDKIAYIQTDSNTVHLVKLLLEKLNEFDEKVCALSNPVHKLQLFTEKETADILKISKRAVFSLRKDGKIHYRDLEIGIRYSMEDIMEFEDSCRKREIVK